jgi:hypothetical protein
VLAAQLDAGLPDGVVRIAAAHADTVALGRDVRRSERGEGVMEATVLSLPFSARWAPLWPGQARLALIWTLAKIVLIMAPCCCRSPT